MSSTVLAQSTPAGSDPLVEKLKSISSSDFAEQLETMLKEKRDLASRLSQAIDEIIAMNELYQQRRDQFNAEKLVLHSEIEKLRALVTQSSNNQEKRTVHGAGVQSLLETRERLVREEFSRKFLDLAVEVKRQRTRYNEQVEEMKKQLSRCICKPAGEKHLRISF